MGDVVLSIDVEWAHPDVLADVVRLVDERGLRATFFCTHAGIAVSGHERALHPNFRRAGNSLVPEGSTGLLSSDSRFYEHVVRTTHAFCPEAVGVRSHSLITDSALLPIYRDAGLQYDSSYMLPLAEGLTPTLKGFGILELPIFYMDYWDLTQQATEFDPARLPLDGPGLRILTFHPNLIFLNAATVQDYEDSRPQYHDPEGLASRRRTGRGVRTLFVDVLDALARRGPSIVMADINARWRAARRP